MHVRPQTREDSFNYTAADRYTDGATVPNGMRNEAGHVVVAFDRHDAGNFKTWRLFLAKPPLDENVRRGQPSKIELPDESSNLEDSPGAAEKQSRKFMCLISDDAEVNTFHQAQGRRARLSRQVDDRAEIS
jgi:hypothetical protein